MERLYLLTLAPLLLLHLSHPLRAAQKESRPLRNYADIVKKTPRPPKRAYPLPHQIILAPVNQKKDGTTIYQRLEQIPSVGSSVVIKNESNCYTIKRFYSSPENETPENQIKRLKRSLNASAKRTAMLAHQLAELKKTE